MIFILNTKRETRTVQYPASVSPSNKNKIQQQQQQEQEPIVESVKESSSDSEEAEDIPYHARENAQPFTYGNLPEGFTTSKLNHVATTEDVVDEIIETPKVAVRSYASAAVNTAAVPAVLPPSPTTLRKSTRPSISPSRPVLRKTPSRQEFEEMLNERREQSLREQNTIATQHAQNAAIQKDLDELQEKLTKKVVLVEHQATNQTRRSSPPTSTPTKVLDLVKLVETVDLPDEKAVSKTPQPQPYQPEHQNCEPQRQQQQYNPQPQKFEPQSQQYEPALIIAETATATTKRSETPSFPVQSQREFEERCISPYPMVTPGTPTLKRINDISIGSSSFGGNSTIVSCESHTRTERQDAAAFSNEAAKNSSTTPAITSEPHIVEPRLVKFAKDCSQFWYKPHITREEAIALLRNSTPGTFIIRNSTTYQNAYGLVLRVTKPPLGIVVQDNCDELVRHYLLEPTTRGVRLKGCANEPVFTSLSALVYEHSINQLALPCKLMIPDQDLLQASGDAELIAAQRQLLSQGAACNVLYLFTCNMESLTGDEAIRKAAYEMYMQRSLPKPIEVHIKVAQQGITLTDNTRRLFFRRHYTAHNISHCALDPDARCWNVVANDDGLERPVKKSIFAFVARPLVGGKDNECHVFCDLAANQPASAIVSFANKVLPMDKQNHKML